MGKTITRQALYDAVWAQPITKLSKDFGISDVGLAKACRKLSVPLPPRGYWARKAAGKPALQLALPPRPPGLSEKTTIGGGGHTWGWRMPSDEVFLGDMTPPPSFDEPIEEVRARIAAMIGKTAIVQRDLEHPLCLQFERPAVGVHQRVALAALDLLAAIVANAADIQDRDGAGPLLRASRSRWPFVKLAFADAGYQGPRVAAASPIRVQIVRKLEGQIGFAVQAKRWVVERFFAWINRNRRLAKDVEATIASAEAFLYAASAILLLRRLAR